MAHPPPTLLPTGTSQEASQARASQSVRRRHRIEAAALFQTHGNAAGLSADRPVAEPSPVGAHAPRVSSPAHREDPPDASRPADLSRQKSYFDAYPHRRTSSHQHRMSSSSQSESFASPKSAASGDRSLPLRPTVHVSRASAQQPSSPSSTPASPSNATCPLDASEERDMDNMVERKYQQALQQVRARNPALQGVIANGVALSSSLSSPSSSQSASPVPLVEPLPALATGQPSFPSTHGSHHSSSARDQTHTWSVRHASPDSYVQQPTAHFAPSQHVNTRDKPLPPLVRASSTASTGLRERSRCSSASTRPNVAFPNSSLASRNAQSSPAGNHARSSQGPSSSASFHIIQQVPQSNVTTNAELLSAPGTTTNAPRPPWLDWYNYGTAPTDKHVAPRQRASSTSISEDPNTRLDKLGPSHRSAKHPESRDHADLNLNIIRYIRSPILTRIFSLQQHPFAGSRVSVADVGDPQGMPVFVFLGLGAIRYVMGLYDDFAQAIGLRLICIDRWGLGKSDRPRNVGSKRVHSWPSVVTDVADQMGIRTFALLAHSAGAPFAMATALACPERVVGPIHLLAPWVHTFAAKDYAYTRFVPEMFIRAVQAADSKVQQWRLGKLPDFDLDEMSLTSSPDDSMEQKGFNTDSPIASSSHPSPTHPTQRVAFPHRRIPSLPPGSTPQSPRTTTTANDASPVGLGLEAELFPRRYPPPSRIALHANGNGFSPPPLGSVDSKRNISVPSRRSRSISSLGPAHTRPNLAGESIKQKGARYGSADFAPAPLSPDLTTALLKASNSESSEGAIDDLLCILGRTATAVTGDPVYTATAGDAAIWGFSYKDVTRPVLVWQGDRDEKLSNTGIKWMVKEMANVNVSWIGGAGHDLMSNAAVVSDILERIAQLKPAWLKRSGN